MQNHKLKKEKKKCLGTELQLRLQSSVGDFQGMFRISCIKSVTTKTHFILFTYCCTTVEKLWFLLWGWRKTDDRPTFIFRSRCIMHFISTEALSFFIAEQIQQSFISIVYLDDACFWTSSKTQPICCLTSSKQKRTTSGLLFTWVKSHSLIIY